MSLEACKEAPIMEFPESLKVWGDFCKPQYVFQPISPLARPKGFIIFKPALARAVMTVPNDSG